MFDLDAVQAALKQFDIDGWLFYDFHASNVLARRILGFKEGKMNTRRWFYMVPATGAPVRLVHRIEQAALDHLPGEKHVYLRWEELEKEVTGLVGGLKRVAMEYSPRNAIPYVAKVDAGTVELVRSAGAEVVSSGDLIQRFEATLDEEQWNTHKESEKHTLTAFNLAVKMIADRVRGGKPPRETEVQATIMGYFEDRNLVTDHPAIVAAGGHSGDPHYEPSPDTDAEVKEGEFVLIDFWAKLSKPRAVYSDYTRMVFVGETVPSRYADVFEIVVKARDAGVDCVRQAFAAGRPLHGWEVDDAARRVIDEAGYGQYFVHRTGHNIAQDLHGNGTHMDNLETRDERLILRNTLFSVEQGIYMPEFGVRSEVNVFVDGGGKIHVTGDPQRKVLPVLGT
jgi:Xaa-Pro aminopeptidase